MIRQLLLSLRQLLASWWNVDRIRIPATSGRLFQLAPGDRLLIGEQLLVVRKRSLLERSAEADSDQSAALGVEYRLVPFIDPADGGSADDSNKTVWSAGGEWRLRILLPNDGRRNTHRLWIREMEEELLEDEIVVLRPAAGR